MIVPFALPDCSEEEINAIAEVIKSGWLTTASKTFQFEENFSEYVGVKYCLAVNSCTAALHLGLEALGIGIKDKVIVPVHTFTASAEVIRYLGADPYFVDVDLNTFCITQEEIEKSFDTWGYGIEDKRVKAVIPVHFGGHPCDMEPILEQAKKYGIKVMEDAAHAFPTLYRPSRLGDKNIIQDSREKNQKMVGTIGDVTCFSFYATKTITTGEGGMLTTDDEKIANRVKIMRLHGINRDIWGRFSDIQSDWTYDIVAPGFKYNMPDLAAAIGIHQLRKAEDFRQKRQKIAEVYFHELKDMPGLFLPKIKCSVEDHSWHLYVVLIDKDKTVNKISRDQFIQQMKLRNIGTSVHYIPLHRMTYYRERYGLKPEMFPNSESIFQRCVSLPIYSAMSDNQLEYVIYSIKKIMSK